MTIFYYGWTNYDFMRQAPRDSMVVKALGPPVELVLRVPQRQAHPTSSTRPLDKPMKGGGAQRRRDPTASSLPASA